MGTVAGEHRGGATLRGQRGEAGVLVLIDHDPHREVTVVLRGALRLAEAEARLLHTDPRRTVVDLLADLLEERLGGAGERARRGGLALLESQDASAGWRGQPA